MSGRCPRGKIPKVKVREDIIDKNLKLRVDTGAFCIVGIFLKFDYSASKVKSFVARRGKKKRSQIGMVRSKGKNVEKKKI